MTYEELLQAHKEQTPLVWNTAAVITGNPNRRCEIVTLPEPPPRYSSHIVAVVRVTHRGKTAYAYTHDELLRIATAQDLLELGDTT